ncbi:MAG: hypothetical protein JW996_05440 [Candidatus Cloacimonetes bacterium]|nr:hypothetical protein [Candidatus Cloacimonadota bacterium]
MKETPQETKIQHNLQAGILTIDGFLGKDTRHFHEIIKADSRALIELEITQQQIADRMEYFTTEAFENYDGAVMIDDIYRVEYRSVRGKIICPFGHSGVFRKGEIILYNQFKKLTVSWTPLSIHMIREHCFFEGKGSKYRLEPAELKAALYDEDQG